MTNDPLWYEIDALAFDAVGTLIEPSPSVALAYTQAAQRQGVEVDRAEVKQRFHQFFRVDEVDEIKGRLATDEEVERRRWRRIVGNVLPELPDVDRAFRELWDHFGHPRAWRVFDDVPQALALLREARVPFVIASNFDARLKGVVRGLPELSDCEESAVISSLVGFRKPHPLFYRAVCEELDRPAHRVLYVGDDLENDVKGPQRAGLRGLRVDRDGESVSDDLAVSNLLDVVEKLLAARSAGEMGVVGR